MWLYLFSLMLNIQIWTIEHCLEHRTSLLQMRTLTTWLLDDFLVTASAGVLECPYPEKCPPDWQSTLQRRSSTYLGKTDLRSVTFWSYAVIVRQYYIKGEHCWIFCGGHFCWSVNYRKEFSEDLLYHIPQQSLVEIILGLLFPKGCDYWTHQLSAYVDWGQMENLAWSCLWLLPSAELMEITAKEKKILKEIKKSLCDLCNLRFLKEQVTSSPILWP